MDIITLITMISLWFGQTPCAKWSHRSPHSLASQVWTDDTMAVRVFSTILSAFSKQGVFLKIAFYLLLCIQS